VKPRSQDLSSDHKKSSDDASVAFPSQCLRSEFAWTLGTLALTSLLVIPLMRLWRASLQVPFQYTGDALFYLMAIKGVLEHGWWLENPDVGAPSGQELYDFPSFVGRSLHLLLIKLLGLLFSDSALVLIPGVSKVTDVTFEAHDFVTEKFSTAATRIELLVDDRPLLLDLSQLVGPASV
jgi:hypothetical protein